MTEKFFNYPKKVDQSFYKNARKTIINYFENDRNLDSIYEYGSVSAPGVSDIDMILVFKKDPSNISKYNFKEIDKDVYDLVANGNVIKMESRTFSSLNYIDQLNMKLMYGENITQSEVPEKFIFTRELISICDWLPERIKRIEIATLKSEINISYILGLLHSLIYSIKKVEKFTQEIEGSSYLKQLISDLRLNWYSKDNPEKLLSEAIIISIEIGLRAIELISKILIKKITLKFWENQYSTSNINVPMHYSINLNFSESLEFDSLANYKKNKRIIFPGIFAYHFINLAHLPTLISKRLSLKIFKELPNSRLDIKDPYQNYLYIKASLISDNLIFIEKNNFNGGLIRYGFYA